jgi:hypothetical protein
MNDDNDGPVVFQSALVRDIDPDQTGADWVMAIETRLLVIETLVNGLCEYLGVVPDVTVEPIYRDGTVH